MNGAEQDPFFTSRAWLEVRYRVLKKHKGCCECCGSRGSAENPIQVDHIQPRSRHPELALVLSNLQVLCRSCNLGKSNKDSTDWRWQPSRELLILETAASASRARLQQLGWLKLNGDSKQIRNEAAKQYRKLWREVEEAWFAKGRPQ